MCISLSAELLLIFSFLWIFKIHLTCHFKRLFAFSYFLNYMFWFIFVFMKWDGFFFGVRLQVCFWQESLNFSNRKERGLEKVISIIRLLMASFDVKIGFLLYFKYFVGKNSLRRCQLNLLLLKLDKRNIAVPEKCGLMATPKCIASTNFVFFRK